MLIIFDCDGVLVDSECLAANIFSDMLCRVGIELDPASCYLNFHGKTLDFCYQWIEKTFDLQLPVSFHNDLVKETEKQFCLHLSPVVGVETVIRYLLSKNIKICVASNGSHDKIANSLRTVGLLNYFPTRFSAEDVSEGKPNPELFLYAAKQMGVAPEKSIVIEDSEAGKQAAIGASMGLIMYRPNLINERATFNEYASMDNILTYLQGIV